MEVFKSGIEVPFGGHSILVWPETIVFGLGVLVVFLVFLLWRSKKVSCRGAACALALLGADITDAPTGVWQCSGAATRVAAKLSAGVNPGPFLTCMSAHVKGALTPQKKGKGKHGNRADNPRPSARYVITENGRNLVKTGITSDRVGAGAPPRLKRQLGARRKAGEKVDGKVVSRGSRAKMLAEEQEVVDRYFERHGKMPPGMRRPLPTQERARRAEERARRRAEGRKAARRPVALEDEPLPHRGK